MTKNIATTTALFILFTLTLYYGAQHPIIGDPTDNNWIMNITVITNGTTYRAIIYNTVKNKTTTHIETIWAGKQTEVYTITYTKPLTTTTETKLTQITTTSTTTTTTATTTTTTGTTTTTTTTVITATITTTTTATTRATIVPPTATSTIITMTTKIIAFDWRSIIIWASIAYPDKTIIGYTTFYYT